jgi:hypothetical protein
VNLPGLIAKSSLEIMKGLQQRQNDLRESVQGLYRPLIKDFSQQIQQHFVSNFTDLREAADGITPTWSMARAKKNKTIHLFQASFDDMADSLEEEASTILDEDLTETYEESYNRQLWLMSQMGMDVSEAEPVGSFSARKALLLAAGVAGIGYLSRLNAITRESKVRFSRVFKGSVAGGLTLAESMNQVEAVSNSLVQRISALSENETKRAANLAAAAVTDQYKEELKGEVWLARETACPQCRALNMKITKATPADSTHPGCRCWKVPIPLDYTGRPVDYIAFLRGLGKR